MTNPDVSKSLTRSALTENDADDIGQVPGLLEQFAGELSSFIADGTYNGDPVYQAVARQQHDPPPDVVIPPRAPAVLSTDSTDRQSQRDRHIRMIAEKGRMAWQNRLRQTQPRRNGNRPVQAFNWFDASRSQSGYSAS